MRLLKPRKLMVSTKPVEEPPRSFLIVTGFAMFDVAEPSALYFDQALLPFAAKELGEQVFDLGMPKPRGELLVYGAAQAPGGRPVGGLDVTVRLGTIEKTLRVLGDRFWVPDRDGSAAMTDPRPFTEMPLDYAHAFGGPDFKKNPKGKGHGAEALLRTGQPAPLPNLEDPRHPVLLPTDTRDPACFAALEATWPQRQAYLGTYDQAWLDRKFPGHPDDTNWSYYNAAPKDQWASGYFAGDETFRIQGMDRDRPVIEGRLPGLVLKAFVNRSDTPLKPGTFEEITMRLDTVWLFGSRSKAILAYRGMVETRYEDASDIESLMLAAESLDGPARPAGYYQDIWGLRSGDPATQLACVFADHQLLPPVSAEQERRREEERSRRRDELRAVQAEQNAARRAQLFERMGFASLAGLADSPTDLAALGLPALAELPVFTDEEIAAGDVDFAALLHWAEQATEQASAKGEALQAQAESLKQDPYGFLEQQGLTQDLPPGFVAPDAARPAPVDVEAQRLRAEAKARGQADPLAGILDTDAMTGFLGENLPEARAGVATGPTLPPWLDEVQGAVPVDLARLAGEVEAQQITPPPTPDAIKDKLETAKTELAEAYTLGRRLSPHPMAPLEDLDPGVAAYLGTVVREEAASGASLAGRDFAGARLAGLDLANRDLRGCCFEKADLSGADFSGSDCTRAVFAGALLDQTRFAAAVLAEANFNAVTGSRTDFSGCDLTKAQFMNVTLPGASFRQARLTEGLFLQSSLPDGDFTGATLGFLMVVQTPLSRAVVRSARLESVVFMDLDLAEADFTGAALKSVGFLKTDCTQTLFDESDLESVVFVGPPKLAGSGFRRCRANQALFREGDLRRSDFSGAVLKHVDFTQADVSGASFWCAAFEQCILTWTRADDATFFEARFLEVMMNRTGLRRSNLARTQFYRTNARKVDTRGAETLDMKLIKSMMTEAPIETQHD